MFLKFGVRQFFQEKIVSCSFLFLSQVVVVEMVGVVLDIPRDGILLREQIFVFVTRGMVLTVEAVDHQDSLALFKVNIDAFL